MSRYIDANELISAMYYYEHNEDGLTAYDAQDIINKAPSIDIVRCKECRHNPWNIDADYTCIWDDDFADREQTPDDFCSYGERKESE